MSLCLTSHNQFICNLISSVFKGFPKCVCFSPSHCHHLSRSHQSLSLPPTIKSPTNSQSKLSNR